MQQSDRPAFFAGFSELCETFGEDPTPDLCQRYWAALEHHSTLNVMGAMARWKRGGDVLQKLHKPKEEVVTGLYFPTVDDLLALIWHAPEVVRQP